MSLQNTLDKLTLDDAPAGGVALVYQHGRLVESACSGTAYMLDGAPVAWQPSTLSLNYSVGKGVMATLVHCLASLGIIDTDAPIAHTWQDFGAHGKQSISWADVLNHRANLFDIASIIADDSVLVDWDDMCSRVANMRPATDTGAVSAYSALVSGFVLGGAIEKACAMDLQSALDKFVCAPLGIVGQIFVKLPKDTPIAVPVRLFDKDNPTPRKKPTLKPDSTATQAVLNVLPASNIWRAYSDTISTQAVNKVYFNGAFNPINYKRALLADGRNPFDYYAHLGAQIPAANIVANAQALGVMYNMLAQGGVHEGKSIISDTQFAKIAQLGIDGIDAVMPASMRWQLGYHRLFNLQGVQGFGHMGYHGAVAAAVPSRALALVYLHNFDTTMLNDIRQFAIVEQILARYI